MGGESSRAAELAAGGLAHLAAVGAADERPDDLAHERSVEAVARVERHDVVDLLPEGRTHQRRHPFRRRVGDVGLDHRHRLGLQQVGGGEERAQRAGLSRDPVVRGADAVRGSQAMGGGERLRVDDRGVAHDLRRAVRRAAVGMDHHGAIAGELLGKRHVHGLHHPGHRGGVVERRQADQDVHLPDRDELPDHLVGERARLGHVALRRGPRATLPRGALTATSAGTSRTRRARGSAGRAARRCAGTGCRRTSRPGSPPPGRAGPARPPARCSTGC